MKVALCLSGQPRHLIECYPKIYKNVIEKLDCDVYAHIWWDNEYQNKKYMWHSTSQYANEDLGKLFLDLYKPKKFIIEKQINFKTDFCKKHNLETWDNVSEKHLDIFTPGVIFALMSQTYSMMKSSQLTSTESYDCLIRCRTDLITNTGLREIINNIPFDNNNIYFQSSCGGGKKYCGEYSNTNCDWFFCGNQSNMITLQNDLHNSIKDFFANGVIHVRDYYKKICEKNNLKINLLDFDATVLRNLDGPNTYFDFLKVENYYETFDEKNKKITNDKDWPFWAKNLSFGKNKNE